MAKERIGILVGRFDPVHRGHISMAVSALDSCVLDRLLVLPLGNPAGEACSASPEDRWKMVVMACTQDERLVPSSLALDGGSPLYTVDLLHRIVREYPKARLFYLLGTDELLNIRRWDRYKEALPLCTFLVCPEGAGKPSAAYDEEKAVLTSLGAKIRTAGLSPLTISSSGLRNSLRLGHPTPDLFGPVREYCAAKGLYGITGRIDRAGPWLDQLFSALNPRRFTHSLSVAAVSRRLAGKYGVDLRQAEEAGLLHDCAKCLPLKEMQRIAVEHSLTDDPAILSSGALMHSLVGAWVARNDYGMADPEVLDAIAFHNTGFPGMSRLAMVVCLADFMEPTRPVYPLLEKVRALSGHSLERALLLSLEGTADYVRSRGKYLHPRTRDTIAWLRTLPEISS